MEAPFYARLTIDSNGKLCVTNYGNRSNGPESVITLKGMNCGRVHELQFVIKVVHGHSEPVLYCRAVHNGTQVLSHAGDAESLLDYFIPMVLSQEIKNT